MNVSMISAPGMYFLKLMFNLPNLRRKLFLTQCTPFRSSLGVPIGSPLYQRFVCLFFVMLSICLLHRGIAVWQYYQIYFIPVYSPESIGEGAEMLWATNGSSLLSGVSNDVAFSFVAAAFLAMPFISRWLRNSAVMLLIFFLGANLEHILYNFTHINLSTAQTAVDLTFIKGQLTKSLVNAILVLFAGAVLTHALIQSYFLARLGGLLIVPICVLSLLSSSSFNFIQPNWMQTHPLLPNIFSPSVEADPQIFSQSAFAAASVPPAPKQTQYNILMVYMEGLSQKSIEVGDMTTLKKLENQHISFSRYLGNQIVTANGLYTTLTGDLPYFLSKKLKWNEVQEQEARARNALPAQLHRAGYHTAFLQSAPLEFMNKGKIAPLLGFSETLGRQAWDRHYSSDGWGIDDRALFEHVLEYVGTRVDKQPWFVSVLTTGTHSPYNVPKNFMPYAVSDRYRALAYLDISIKELMDGLEARGLLENTVVIFTSDESRENALENPLKDQLTLNWLPLVIQHPSGLKGNFDFFIDSQRLPEIVLALVGDLNLSRLSGLEQTHKPFLMGNHYANRLFWFDPTMHTFFACDTHSFICSKFSDVTDPMNLDDSAPHETAYYPNLERLFIEQEFSK